MTKLHEKVSLKIAEIEAEMRAVGYWQEGPLPASAYEFKVAFAADTMTLSQWLQFTFIPRVKGVLADRGDFPPKSMVGAYASREFDGSPEASTLTRLLCEFDSQFRGN